MNLWMMWIVTILLFIFVRPYCNKRFREDDYSSGMDIIITLLLASLYILSIMMSIIYTYYLLWINILCEI